MNDVRPDGLIPELRYSKLIVGTMLWGVWGMSMTKEMRTRLIHTAYDLDMTSFDHADIYGNYTTEKDFGAAFKAAGISRDKVQFISKCGIAMIAESKPYRTKHYKYDANYIIESVHTSLRNLNTHYVDLQLLHRPSPLMHPEEIAKAVEHLITSGKIRSFGVSNFTPSQLSLLSKHLPISANQIEISATHNIPMFNGQLDYCMEHNIIPMGWSPLGLLKQTEDKWPSKLKTALAVLCEKHNTTYAPLLLAWLLKHPSRIHPIVGTTKPSRLNEVSKALEIHFDDEDWFFLLESVREKPCP